jgi:hypothetical protein
MKASRFLRAGLWALCLTLAAAGLCAQTPPDPEAGIPLYGQEGKDVVWIPTRQAQVEKMLDIAAVTAEDYLIDLGSGDGRLVITAAGRGARALGIEYDEKLVSFARRRARMAGVGDRARFVQGDIFASDISRADVITLFLNDELNLRLRPRLLALRPGTRIVSNTFHMGEWQPDRTAPKHPDDGCSGRFCNALLWIVPARVQGDWLLPQGVLRLTQHFQRLSGTLESGGESIPVTRGRLAGTRIDFLAGEARYEGFVEGDRMRGTRKRLGKEEIWSAAVR